LVNLAGDLIGISLAMAGMNLFQSLVSKKGGVKMPGQFDHPMFLFDVTGLRVEETVAPILAPQFIIPVNTGFKVSADFTCRRLIGHFFHFFMALVPTNDWEVKYFAEHLGGTNDHELGRVPGRFNVHPPFPPTNHDYSSPETDLVVTGGISIPGNYKLTCTVQTMYIDATTGAVTYLPITGFWEGPTIQIYAT
jgi:hypothetical protein